MIFLRLFLVAALAAFPLTLPAAESKEDAEFDKLAEEYIKGWLNAHPIAATSLGFHEYDGRINDFTRLSLDAELSRLRRFDLRLAKFDAAKLGDRARSTCASCRRRSSATCSTSWTWARSRTTR
jgi:hypothetical protein